MSKLQITTPAENTIRFERFFAARRETVFKAYAEPDLMLKWYSDPDMPLTELSSDFRVGGKLKMVWSGPEGSMVLHGVWLELDAPNLIKFTENWEEDWTGGEVINTVEFKAQDGGTLMVMTSTYSSTEARDGAIEPSSGGMEVFFANLDALLQELEAAA